MKDAIESDRYDQDGGLMIEGFKYEEGFMDECQKQIHALRMLSLNVVDTLVKWRE